MKLVLFIIILSIPILSFSQIEVQYFERLDLKEVKADLDTIKTEMDSTFFYVNATYEILKEEVQLFGLKKTIQINSDIFFPFIFFCGLYFLWLKNRK